MKPTKEQIWTVVAYGIFMLLFWLLGDVPKMNQYTAFFGLLALNLIFWAGKCFIIDKIITKNPQK